MGTLARNVLSKFHTLFSAIIIDFEYVQKQV